MRFRVVMATRASSSVASLICVCGFPVQNAVVGYDTAFNNVLARKVFGQPPLCAALDNLSQTCVGAIDPGLDFEVAELSKKPLVNVLTGSVTDGI